ncbi:site-specific integrase [Helicobacter suis]|uniref:site-specific integrase n=1 Tax=Helicobacter suis TaxID=104628 RepID=UPI0013D2A925|nr:site-specific integrase [Helicobacter suis]
MITQLAHANSFNQFKTKEIQMRIYTRKNQLYAEYYTDEGKRVRKSLGLKDTAKNRAKLNYQLEARIQAAQTKKRFIDPLEVPLATTIEEFKERYIGYKQSSQLTIENRLKTIVKLLEVDVNMPTAKLNHEHMRNFYKGLVENNYNTNSIVHLTTLLKSLLEFATFKGQLEKTPYYKQKILIAPAPKKIEVFSLDRVLEILRECDQPYLKTYLTIAFFSGMRVGEILALTWGDMDFKNHTITINKALNGLGEITTPKTANSIRVIDMLPIVEKRLKEFSLFMDVINKDTPIFGTNPKLQMIMTKQWAKLLESLELEHIKLYSTRHTFASIMLERGEEPLWVSHTLGHKNLQITYKVYAKYIPEQNKPRATFLEGVEI